MLQVGYEIYFHMVDFSSMGIVSVTCVAALSIFLYFGFSQIYTLLDFALFSAVSQTLMGLNVKHAGQLIMVAHFLAGMLLVGLSYLQNISSFYTALTHQRSHKQSNCAYWSHWVMLFVN